MKISVITACYNSEATVAKSIESFLAQDYQDKELIVVDGASKDRTCDVVKSYASPLISLQSEPDRGIYDAMNKGLRRVTGDAFGCLNSDDCYHSSESLSLIAEALKTSDVVSGQLYFVREHDGSAPTRIWNPAAFTRGAYRWGYTVPHPTTYARRCVLDKVGEFVPAYRSAGDYDWILRALELEGFSHQVIDAVLVDMRVGGESTNGLRALYNNSREMLAVRQRRLGSGVVDMALILNLLRKVTQTLPKRLLG